MTGTCRRETDGVVTAPDARQTRRLQASCSEQGRVFVPVEVPLIARKDGDAVMSQRPTVEANPRDRRPRHALQESTPTGNPSGRFWGLFSLKRVEERSFEVNASMYKGATSSPLWKPPNRGGAAAGARPPLGLPSASVPPVPPPLRSAPRRHSLTQQELFRCAPKAPARPPST